LAAALGDDANFAATVTTSLAGKQPLDIDLTTIAALTPADGSVLARVAGAWSSRTGVQLKSDLALDNVNNTSDAAKPISTATQAALDGKAAATHTHTSVTRLGAVLETYGIVAAVGDPGMFFGVGSFANQWVVVRCFIPAGLPPLTRMVTAIRGAGTFVAGSGIPNRLFWSTDAGVRQGVTPDDDALWASADWYIATLDVPVPTQSSDTWVYAGMNIGGYTGGGSATQFVLSDSTDAGTVPFARVAGSNQRICAYAGGAAPTSFNPVTVGTPTNSRPFLGFMV
jgi:hypothetical protein